MELGEWSGGFGEGLQTEALMQHCIEDEEEEGSDEM